METPGRGGAAVERALEEAEEGRVRVHPTTLKEDVG